MSLPILHFAHANGFPAGSYRVLLEPLKTHWKVESLDRFGHNPTFPVDHNWQALVNELLDHLQQACSDQKVTGIGHSLGGVITYMAALKQPQRFEQIILLDPPLMTGLDSLGLKLAKKLGFIDKVTPAGITRGRRSHWPNRELAIEYFASKKLFSKFHAQALADYVDHGTEPDPRGGIRLRFDPGVEVAIFRNLADHLSGSLKRLQVPVTLVRGQQSDLLTPEREKRLKRSGFSCISVPGGHMFPLEHPEETRHCLLQLLKPQQ
ncbi:alpha/beta fold hydrolase [Marinospirillum alkaliphilum]|uniref:Pimeloyl-ACP methyl ester carboxylesterase n=1 Tax=Marinospirillum alkaliphilum DSM 21637 TaxID=1122209 RepID=A0A1K1U1J5_9GAMM|nr:alpha/beta hydrolase [Marinospirillum alkaliphilum]SFX06664.1 Pimeloyl-ACP methyl ester carboxylesterase [Marinospirillum alkaliphilum DSM 21637]